MGLKCIPRACNGINCKKDCSGPGCKQSGCIGKCNPNGRCLDSECISVDCFGPDCGPDGKCHGPNCKITTCQGRGCESGVCDGPDCEESDDDCKKDGIKSARRCTEVVSKIRTKKPTSGYKTTTRTACKTVTGCDLKPTTITTTSKIDKLQTRTITESYAPDDPRPSSYYKSVAKSIMEEQEKRDSARFGPKTTPTRPNSPTKIVTVHPVPTHELEVECFDKGSFASRNQMMAAVSEFCNKYKGDTLDSSDIERKMKHPLLCTNTGLGCILDIHISVKVINGCKVEIDGDTGKEWCGGSFRQAIDKCDQNVTKFKQGGKVTTECAVWTIDPIIRNPLGGIHMS